MYRPSPPVPATESSVTVLRRGLRNLLRGAALSDDERYDLLLATGEAVSNAIEHAADPSEPFFEVVATIGDAGVTIVVCDHGQWRDVASGVHRGRGQGPCKVSFAWSDLRLWRPAAEVELAEPPLCPSPAW